MKYQLTEEQQKHPLFFALGKMEKRITKDMRQVPEDTLREGMSKIANSILWACTPEEIVKDTPPPGVVNE